MRWMALALCALFLMEAGAQPASLTLRAKLRDFKDYLVTDPSTHPDFENDAYMACGGRDLGYVAPAIGLTGTVDTTLYREDNRGPVLVRLNHPTRTTQKCFTSMEYFDDWYNDRPYANRSFYIDLVLTRNAQGMYTYNDDNFLPLNTGAGWRKFRPEDPDPYGPRADITPNDVWGFTMEIHTSFTYTAGQGQVFTFKGDDDVWVFINGRLAIDLGGLHDQLTSTVNLDAMAATLGLTNGNSYPLDFFFAERHSTGSHCQITTSLQLGDPPKIPIPDPPVALPVPVADPPGQTFRGTLSVSLSVPGHPAAQIRYTLDGSEPGLSSPLYAGPLELAASTTVMAKAFETGWLPSPVMTEVYTLELLALLLPVAAPPGQAFEGSLSVTLSVPGHPAAQIRYTLDGSEPEASSPLYAGPLVFVSSDTLKARAFEPQWLPSGVLNEIYLLRVPPNVITLRMDTTMVDKAGTGVVTYPDPVRRNPIAVISSDGGPVRCLSCLPGAEDTFLRPGPHAEWTVTSRDPFRYSFHIYDHLGQFVVAQGGDVGRDIIGPLPADAKGFRSIRFRWIPITRDGRSVGTGAYILRGKVISDARESTAASPAGTEKGRSEMSLLKTFGFIRKD